MSTISDVVGRRLPDTVDGKFPLPYDQLQAGDIWKKLNPDGTEKVVTGHPSNLTQRAWMCMTPGKLFGNLIAHTVRENDDGTVSIIAGDGSSNSIMVERRPGEGWHGYVDHNVWRSVD